MRHSLFLLFAIVFVVSSCKKYDHPADNPPANSYAGYMYTSTNATIGNGIIALGRKHNGALTELPGSPYLTGAAGAASRGDFDTQWALRLVGDYLLAVNAGANPTNGSISVFKVNRTNGSLTQVDQNPATPAMDNMDAHGMLASAIAATTIQGTTWVVVANQHSSIGFIMDPPQAVGSVVASRLRNLAVFTMDLATGVLQFRNVGPVYESGGYGGPSTVEFNADGTKLITTTGGIPHFDTPEPQLSVQRPGRLFVYSFSFGVLTETGMYEETGLSGETAALWSPNGKYIYLCNLNLNSSKEDNSVTVHDGTTADKLQNFGTGDRNDENCWSYISLDHTKFYTASFSPNLVNVFDIGSDDKLSKSLTPNFFARRNVPAGDTKDMYEAGGYLYVLGALKSHTISTFKTSVSGALNEQGSSPFHIPSSIGKTELQHAYLGLTGFENQSSGFKP